MSTPEQLSVPRVCTTCGEVNPEIAVVQCGNCDGERYYYQLKRWREAAETAESQLQALTRPRWWRRKSKSMHAVEQAMAHARELDAE